MKNYLLCAILSFATISCSTESDVDPSLTSDSNLSKLYIKSQVPHNNANPFEGRGKEYFDLLTIYLDNNKVPNSATEMTEQIQFMFQNYKTKQYASRSTASLTSKQVAMVLSAPEKQLIAILESCSLRLEVRKELIHFVQALLAQQDSEYLEQYNYIVSYETKILENTTMSEDEKETILSVASVSRYALYADSKHRDRDWEISIGNRKAQPTFLSYQATIISVILLSKKLL
ncbi:hypothetical protein [Flavobacterium sp. DSR3-2]|uniref:hypothetical protein n=1 Tax=Flavobacterium sp. DSR3-2 TaxID=2804634 RepID=UPI003CEB9CB2